MPMPMLAKPRAALALGRCSRMPAIRVLCRLYVELVRGVPLISVLFMASFLFPLFLPVGATPDMLLRALLEIALFRGRLSGRNRARWLAIRTKRAA